MRHHVLARCGFRLDNQRFASGAYFVVAAEKKYTALKDEKGSFNAAKRIQFNFGIGLAPKETVSTWAKFPAPPADVDKVTLYLPGAPPIEDVAIGK
ncbi:MAG TPA: hypothetical protein VE977_12860 [Pyrinomonadaceae bacterium]|nr:hypothetical protein [Pyrinomonadaceae bacterium]